MRIEWLGLGMAVVLMTGCGGSPGGAPAAAEVAPEPEPAKPAPVKRTVTLAEGTAVKVRTSNTVSTESARPGELFSARLAEALVVDGTVVAPQGARVEGLVASADEGGRVKGVAALGLRLLRVRMGGEDVVVQTGTYRKEAPATKKQDAMKVGIGAGIGAAVGAIAGGGKGAAVGAASGAGAGTAVVLATRGAPAVVEAESLLTFRLTAPVTVTVVE